MKIGIQGESGSFSHQAASRAFPDTSILPCALSAECFDRLGANEVDALMIPIENTLAGSVVEHYDLLRERDVHIEQESLLRIEHHVIGVPGSTLAGVRRVYSHPVALAQCKAFLRRYPAIEAIAFYDTAGAAKQITEQRDATAAAIAGEQAAEIYGGAVLARNVEDDAANFTRFLLVRAGEAALHCEGPHKLSLCCEVDDRPGALAGVLTAVAAEGGNLTHVQSRPVHGRPWHYHVFLDARMESEGATKRLLDGLGRLCPSFKVLGLYPPMIQAAPIATGG